MAEYRPELIKPPPPKKNKYFYKLHIFLYWKRYTVVDTDNVYSHNARRILFPRMLKNSLKRCKTSLRYTLPPPPPLGERQKLCFQITWIFILVPTVHQLYPHSILRYEEGPAQKNTYLVKNIVFVSKCFVKVRHHRHENCSDLNASHCRIGLDPIL